MSLHRALMLPTGLLLVAGTVLCGVKRSPEEKAAIGAIEKLGGRVGYGIPIAQVNLNRAEVTDADLVHVKG